MSSVSRSFACHRDSRSSSPRLAMPLLLCMVSCASAAEGDAAGQSASAVARELANPNTSLATLQFSSILDTVSRGPMASSGLSAWLAPCPPRPIRRVSGKQLRLGPEFLLAKFEDSGLYGIFPSHQWTVSGWSDESFSTTQFQPVLRFLPGEGWSVGTSPIGNYNWTTDEWTIPINLSVSKTAILGSRSFACHRDSRSSSSRLAMPLLLCMVSCASAAEGDRQQPLPEMVQRPDAPLAYARPTDNRPEL